MFSLRSNRTRLAAVGLLGLTVLAACSDTTTAPSRLSPRSPSLTILPTPSQIIGGTDAGYFSDTYVANESGRLTSEFWDNVSSDNSGAAKCDVGFYASATILAGCLNEQPGSTANATTPYSFMWGDNGGPAGNGMDASSFMFNGSQSYTVTLLGSYAGAGSTIGWFTKTGTTYTFNPVTEWSNKQLDFAVTIPAQPAGTTWGFFVNTLDAQTGGCGGVSNPNYACSDATGGFTAAPNQQFALFANSTGTQFLVGTEDNELLLLNDLPNPLEHDSDYNDYIFSVVPIAPPAENHGCTLGYWKNHTTNWPSPYTTSTTIAGAGFTNSGVGTTSMFDALSFKGGPTVQDAKNLLLKQAVAALLNAATSGMNYPLTTAQIVSEVNTALASGDRNTILTEASRLEGFNSLEGPLC